VNRGVALYTIKKADLPAFVNSQTRKYEIIAPVATNLVRFTPIKRFDETHLEGQAYFPAKEYFFKKKEKIFDFEENKVTTPEKELNPRIIFGLRKCDLNGIKVQDNIFLNAVKDPYYKTERENTLLMGIMCTKKCNEYAFCGSMQLQDYGDIMLYENKDDYDAEILSQKGQELVNKNKRYFKPKEGQIDMIRKTVAKTDRLKKRDIKKYFDREEWIKGASLCLSCGACNTLCPTCYCHEFHDEVKMNNLKKGSRIRTWSGCQMLDFTRVAGDFIFRKERLDRFKHRIYHQMQYYEERYLEKMCNGCGRCISGCPKRIEWVDLLNEM
jgi:ferredoxin